MFITVLWGLQTGTALAKNAMSTEHRAQLKGPYENGAAVTRDCLKCHLKQAEEVLHSAHWRWQGPSPHVQGLENQERLGKKNLINNF